MTRTTAFGYTVYLLLGWSSVLIPSLVIYVERSFNRTDAAIGLVYLMGALLYAGGALGGGFLAETFGARPVLATALLILATGLLFQGWTSVWVIFLVAAAIAQCGSGAADGGVQAVFLELFPDERGAALNRLHLFYGLGALLGPATVGIAITAGFSWRPIFIGSAAVTLLLAATIVTLPKAGVTEQPSDETLTSEPVLALERNLIPFLWLAVSIGCYEAATIGIASWLVRFLSDESVRVATGALSMFWAGICAVRLIAPWLMKRLPATPFTVGCIVGMSVSLTMAVLVPWPMLAVALFALTGVCVGPIYPMLVAIGGDLYPRRLATLSGGLTTAATLGAIIYPPLMGLVAESVGIRNGLLGAAVLGIPTALALLAATRLHVSKQLAAPMP